MEGTILLVLWTSISTPQDLVTFRSSHLATGALDPHVFDIIGLENTSGVKIDHG